MAVYFIADVHLDEQLPQITQHFLRLLRRLQALSPRAIYILGDLFEYWIGDDCLDNFHYNIAGALAKINCPIYFQHGNRDFLLGNEFASRAHLTILPERKLLHLDGASALIEHGDLLCRQDVAYLRLRKIFRQNCLQRLFAKLPNKIKHALANYLRARSCRATATKSAALMDVCNNYVNQLFTQYRCQILIHGHTHRPAIHRHAMGTRYVLGAWHPDGIILRYHNNEFKLLKSGCV